MVRLERRDHRGSGCSGHAERTVGPITLFTVDLSRRDYDEYYRGFANDTLWPTLHYQVGHGHFEWAEFAGYRRVNTLFAQALARLVRPDDLIWVHDYHLLCLAEALREAGLRNRMGLFLHTPFPAPAVFMTNPSHEELIRAMCQFDLLGFQTEDDRSAFADYVLRQAGGRRWMRRALAVFGRDGAGPGSTRSASMSTRCARRRRRRSTGVMPRGCGPA